MNQNNRPLASNVLPRNPAGRVTIGDILRISGYADLSGGEAQAILTSIRQLASLIATHIQKSHARERP
jgi:hypothetical protein